MSRITAVLWDFDGTLCDTNRLVLNSWQAAFRAIEGHEVPEHKLLATFGEPLDTTMERFFGERAEEALAAYRDYQRDIFLDSIELYPGAEDVIKELKRRGYKQALVTSRIRESTLQALDKFGLLPYMDCVITHGDTVKHKPDGEPAAFALSLMGVSPENAVMVGDSRYDIECAKNAGVRSILVEWSQARSAQGTGSRPDWFVSDMHRIVSILEED